MESRSTSDFRSRLGTYCLGLAIGCVLVGMLLSMRRWAASQQGAEPAASGTPIGAGAGADDTGDVGK